MRNNRTPPMTESPTFSKEFDRNMDEKFLQIQYIFYHNCPYRLQFFIYFIYFFYLIIFVLCYNALQVT